jgi:hypothetical protein
LINSSEDSDIDDHQIPALDERIISPTIVLTKVPKVTTKACTAPPNSNKRKAPTTAQPRKNASKKEQRTYQTIECLNKQNLKIVILHFMALLATDKIIQNILQRTPMRF